MQLKVTMRLGQPDSGGNFRFRLPVGNYKNLICPSMVPRYLVVLALPENKEEWLAVGPDALVLRKCCYWVSLAGCPESGNRSNVTVSIPEMQRFDPEALVNLIDRSRRGI